MRVKNKYNAQKTEAIGRKYDSKLEASYARKLHDLKEGGLIAFWLEQVNFPLPGNVKFRLDFLEFWFNEPDDYSSFDLVATEVKGRPTKDYIIKKKQVEELYQIKINEVRKVA